MSGIELARWALYFDLGVLFGLPAAAVLTRARLGPGPMRWALIGAAIVGLPLSLAGYLLTIAAMAGTAVRDLDWSLVVDLTTDSALGHAFLVRIAMVATALSILIVACNEGKLAAIPSAAALATLSWSGHAAAGEGSMFVPRLITDIAHLLAASTWVGALMLFINKLFMRTNSLPDVIQPLARFAGIGSAIVSVLMLTGLGNLWFAVKPTDWPHLAGTSYGYLLGAKLGLFAAMLAMAALNRFVLVPRLTGGGKTDISDATIMRLQISISAEFCIAIALLGLVSVLGMLDPLGA